MHSRRQRKTGFTLVEILIVVVILGILAAVVIPQFTNASQDARANSLVTQLQTVRSQLELFQIQHNGNYPTLDDTWAIMTTMSFAGETGPAAGTATTADLDRLGPYLQQPPANTFAPDGVDPVTVAADNSAAWQYDAAAGTIFAVVEQANIDDMGLSLSDVVAAAAGG